MHQEQSSGLKKFMAVSSLVNLHGWVTLIPMVHWLAPRVSLVSATTFPELRLSNCITNLFQNLPSSKTMLCDATDAASIGCSVTSDVTGSSCSTLPAWLKGWSPKEFQVLGKLQQGGFLQINLTIPSASSNNFAKSTNGKCFVFNLALSQDLFGVLFVSSLRILAQETLALEWDRQQ